MALSRLYTADAAIAKPWHKSSTPQSYASLIKERLVDLRRLLKAERANADSALKSHTSVATPVHRR